MPWSHLSPMDQQTQFLANDLRNHVSVTELGEFSGVSRKTGDTWIDRDLTHGPQGLEERSCRPRTSPRHTPDLGVAASLEAQCRHPSWGAKKLLAILSHRPPHGPWPARSTVCDILSRHWLVPTTHRRRVIEHPGNPASHIGAPNAVWSATSKSTSRPVMAATAISSPSPTVTAASCARVKPSLPPVYRRRNPS
jgi:hypothetical protein